MIVPFSELKLFLSDFEGKYLSSFVNDLVREGSFECGVLVAEACDKTGYVLISGGAPVLSRVIAFSDDEQISTDIPIDALLEEKSLDLYLMAVKDDAVFKSLTDFFVYPLSLYAPYRFVNVPMLVSSFAERKASAVLAFKHGSALNFAVFDKGNFSLFCFFDSAENRYVFGRDPVSFGSYLGSLDLSKPVVMSIEISEKAFSSSFFRSRLDFLEKDPVSSETDLYAGVFSLVLNSLAKVVSAENVGKMSEKLFAYLRKKYPGLYSSLAYSAETASVNWETLLDDRKNVPAEYRFGEYHRYLDEILGLFLKSAAALLGRAGASQLQLDVRAFIQNSESGNKDFSGMFDRFDNLLKILQ